MWNVYTYGYGRWIITLHCIDSQRLNFNCLVILYGPHLLWPRPSVVTNTVAATDFALSSEAVSRCQFHERWQTQWQARHLSFISATCVMSTGPARSGPIHSPLLSLHTNVPAANFLKKKPCSVLSELGVAHFEDSTCLRTSPTTPMFLGILTLSLM